MKSRCHALLLIAGLNFILSTGALLSVLTCDSKINALLRDIAMSDSECVVTIDGGAP